MSLSTRSTKLLVFAVSFAISSFVGDALWAISALCLPHNLPPFVRLISINFQLLIVQRAGVYYGLCALVGAENYQQVADHCGFALLVELHNAILFEFVEG